jgi:hypothetical protein
VERQKKQYGGVDPNLLPRIKAGDWVMRFLPACSKKKMGIPWRGPFLVVRRLSPITLELQESKVSRRFTVHCDHVKLYKAEEMPTSWLAEETGSQNSEQEGEQLLEGRTSDIAEGSMSPLSDRDVGVEARCLSEMEDSESDSDDEFDDIIQSNYYVTRSGRAVVPLDRYGLWD